MRPALAKIQFTFCVQNLLVCFVSVFVFFFFFLWCRRSNNKLTCSRWMLKKFSKIYCNLCFRIVFFFYSSSSSSRHTPSPTYDVDCNKVIWKTQNCDKWSWMRWWENYVLSAICMCRFFFFSTSSLDQQISFHLGQRNSSSDTEKKNYTQTPTFRHETFLLKVLRVRYSAPLQKHTMRSNDLQVFQHSTSHQRKQMHKNS